MLTIYTLKTCDTCRKALKWLVANQISHAVKAIRETPPTAEEIETAIATTDGDLRLLFNTSGGDYRALGLKEAIREMSNDEAIRLLTGNGNLIKRPFAIQGATVLLGFHEAKWNAALS